MLKKINTELFWLIGIYFLSYLTTLTFLNESYDISNHDTYFVISKNSISQFLFVIIGFFTFSIRSVIAKFKNKFSNVIAIIFTLLVLLLIWSFYNLFHNADTMNKGWTVYPPATHKLIGEEKCSEIILETLGDSLFTVHKNCKDKDILLRTDQQAIKIVEPILFETYSKEQIESQKPYESYLINGYWIIKGTLSQNYEGGVFRTIVDAYSGKILDVSHGK